MSIYHLSDRLFLLWNLAAAALLLTHSSSPFRVPTACFVPASNFQPADDAIPSPSLPLHQIDEFSAQQFLFQRQWQSLHDYANKLGIQIIGDMPIYVGGHSADVWANRKQFMLVGGTGVGEQPWGRSTLWVLNGLLGDMPIYAGR